MTNIQRFNDYSRYDSMSSDFFKYFQTMIVESNNDSYKKTLNKIVKDLKLNVKLIGTFGAGIGGLFPIVEALMKNIKSVEVTPHSVVLLTICAFTIIFLEEKKSKTSQEEELLTKDSKSMLEELKMMGIGNGIVKKLVKSFGAIKGIFTTISKYLGIVTSNFIDMFAYTSLMIPVMNGIAFVVGKYDLNLDTLIQNFIGLSVGVGSIIAKYGLKEIINRLKGKFSLNKDSIINSVEIPNYQKFIDITSDDGVKGDMITEQ